MTMAHFTTTYTIVTKDMLILTGRQIETRCKLGASHACPSRADAQRHTTLLWRAFIHSRFHPLGKLKYLSTVMLLDSAPWILQIYGNQMHSSKHRWCLNYQSSYGTSFEDTWLTSAQAYLT
jgi:hypothetical protein